MTTHRTDVCVSFGAPTDAVAVPMASKVDDEFVPREQRESTAIAGRHRELDPPAHLDVDRTGHHAGLVPSAYVDYDAIDTLVRFIGHPVEERA